MGCQGFRTACGVAATPCPGGGSGQPCGGAHLSRHRPAESVPQRTAPRKSFRGLPSAALPGQCPNVNTASRWTSTFVFEPRPDSGELGLAWDTRQASAARHGRHARGWLTGSAATCVLLTCLGGAWMPGHSLLADSAAGVGAVGAATGSWVAAARRSRRCRDAAHAGRQHVAGAADDRRWARTITIADTAVAADPGSLVEVHERLWQWAQAVALLTELSDAAADLDTAHRTSPSPAGQEQLRSFIKAERALRRAVSDAGARVGDADQGLLPEQLRQATRAARDLVGHASTPGT